MDSEKQSFNDIIQGETPVLVDFKADWCGPCKMMAPVLKELAAEMGDQVRVIKVDVDKNPSVSAKYQIHGVPTFILFQNGKVVWRQSGAIPKSQLVSAIQSAAKKTNQ